MVRSRGLSGRRHAPRTHKKAQREQVQKAAGALRGVQCIHHSAAGAEARRRRGHRPGVAQFRPSGGLGLGCRRGRRCRLALIAHVPPDLALQLVDASERHEGVDGQQVVVLLRGGTWTRQEAGGG